MASPTKKTVVVATSPVECSSISTLKNTAIGEAVSEAASPGEWIGLMGSQSCSDDRPEFEAIKKLNIVSVSGDVHALTKILLITVDPHLKFLKTKIKF